MSEKNQSVELFDTEKGQAIAAQADASAVARATQEIQAALVIAQRFPRDEVRAKSRILEACKRKELAEVAEYEYSRGGTRITGPTIDLLRAIANRWGNIRFGWAEVDRRDGQSSVRCFAWDMQSNGQAERTFTVKHWRDTQGGGYGLTDERDIYELMANQAARRVRACLEEVIDADIVTAAVDQCRGTLRTGEKTPLVDRAVQMVTAFAEFGVTQAMIELRLGNKLEAISDNQLASLRRIFKALKDGVGKREDYFKPEAAKPAFAPASTEGAPASAESAPASTEGAPASTEAKAGLQPGATGLQPAATQPAAPVRLGSGFNPVKAVRGLCKMAHIKEGELLEQLAKDGTTDGSWGSLEELGLSSNGAEILRGIADAWPDVVARFAELKGDK